VQLKKGGITHLRLNNDGKPIANKYRKGKMKRTLKRESKELEAVEMDAVGHNDPKGSLAGSGGVLLGESSPRVVFFHSKEESWLSGTDARS